MNSQRVVIAVTGMPGSGKGSFIGFYEKRGALVFRMGDMVRGEVARRELSPDPKNVGRVANEMRELHGPDIWARRTVEAIREHVDRQEKRNGSPSRDTPILIIDGVRSMKEVSFFKQAIPRFYLVAIHTSPELRWKRMRERKRSDDFPEEALFRERDRRELNWGIAEVIALADEILSNNGTFEELEEKAEEFLERLSEAGSR